METNLELNSVENHSNLLEDMENHSFKYLFNDEEPKQGLGLSINSKKISKKRTKYQRIDDSLRQQLIDAVIKDGQMLKTAAKKYQINYSSAKSILHTYKKEGRVNKKTVRDRYFRSSLINYQNEDSLSQIYGSTPLKLSKASQMKGEDDLTSAQTLQANQVKVAPVQTLNHKLIMESAETSLKSHAALTKFFLYQKHCIIQKIAQQSLNIKQVREAAQRIVSLAPLMPTPHQNLLSNGTFTSFQNYTTNQPALSPEFINLPNQTNYDKWMLFDNKYKI